MMTLGAFTLEGAQEVVDLLTTAGISAGLDPAEVTLPGVWVQVGGFELDTMTTFRTDLRLQLVTGDKDDRRAMESLVELAAQVHPVIPTGKARARTVLLPDGTGLPALEVLTSTRNPRAETPAP